MGVIGINLRREVRQEAGRAVGARVVDEGLGAAFIAFMVVRGWGGVRVSPRWVPGEQGAGDHEGNKCRTPPPFIHPRPYGVTNAIS